MSNADVFKDSFNKLEKEIKNKYNLNKENSIFEIFKNKELIRFKNDFTVLNDIRNILAHEPKLNYKNIIEPSEETLKLIDNLYIEIFQPKKVLDISIKISYIKFANINESVKKYLKIMRDKKYTCIPILENGKVIGVFSENSLFRLFIDEDIFEIDDNTKFENIKKYLEISDDREETFDFISKENSIYQLQDKYNVDFSKRKRIGAYFITNSGKKEESLLGMITPWDLVLLDK